MKPREEEYKGEKPADFGLWSFSGQELNLTLKACSKERASIGLQSEQESTELHLELSRNP